MNRVLGSAEIERFRRALTLRLGLVFDESKTEFLTDVLQRRVEQNGMQYETYMRLLERDAPPGEINALAAELTVAETYFFRNADQYRALVEDVLPDRLQARSASRTLRILSAGCATGEEPYSLAIAIRERVHDPSWETTITAIDVNPAVLEKAAQARYTAWSLRETPGSARDSWFRREGKEWTVVDSIRGSVSFSVRNLVLEDLEFWRPQAFDIVLCRNVLMYFAPDQARAVVARISRSLTPGGYLFLGHAETMRGLSHNFHLRHTQGTFYYQRKDRLPPDEAAPGTPAMRAITSSVETLAAVIEHDGTWVDAIQRAAERIQALAAAPAGVERAAAVSPPTPTWDLGLPLELLRRERFSEALDLVTALPPESSGNTDVLVLQAVLLTHKGQLSLAEKVCRGLLEIDEFHAGAHYVLALCREGAGDFAGALEHDRAAIYFDPAFAMPRLHAGLLARRAGDAESMRRELNLAATLLQSEDASRLLLFGGGFSREALVSLCRAELGAEGVSTR